MRVYDRYRLLQITKARLFKELVQRFLCRRFPRRLHFYIFNLLGEPIGIPTSSNCIRNDQRLNQLRVGDLT